MKKVLSFVLVLALTLSLFACQVPNDKNDPKDPPKAESGEAVALVTVDINPSIEITLDENGTVASLYGANEDGQILLYGEIENLEGMSYEDAIAYITDLAINLGYLDAETGTVNTSVVADDLAFAEEIQSKLGDKIKATASENGITISIDTADPFSLLCELEELKAKYPDRADIQEVTPTEYKLALILSEREDISVIAALEYDSSEMISRINAAHATLENYATEAYIAAKREASRIFEMSMGIAIAGAYNDVYMKHLTSHYATFYYGAAYQAYATTALTYRSVYEIKVFGDSMVNYEPNAATIEAIKTELGLSDTTALENEDGKITLDSLISFCDDFLAKNVVSEDVKAEIKNIIGDAKAAAELANKATTTMYATDMANLKTQIGIVISAINTTYNASKFFMNDEQKAEIEACIDDLELVEAQVGEIMEGGVTLSEVDALATDAEEKAKAMLEKIKGDLSESELAEAEARIEELKALQTKLTTDFENRLTVAENEAKKYIEDARKARESKESDN